MTETINPETYKKYKRAAQIINGAGGTPLSLNDTLIRILKHIVPDEEVLDYVRFFKKRERRDTEFNVS